MFIVPLVLIGGAWASAVSTTFASSTLASTTTRATTTVAASTTRSATTTRQASTAAAAGVGTSWASASTTTGVSTSTRAATSTASTATRAATSVASLATFAATFASTTTGGAPCTPWINGTGGNSLPCGTCSEACHGSICPTNGSAGWTNPPDAEDAWPCIQFGLSDTQIDNDELGASLLGSPTPFCDWTVYNASCVNSGAITNLFCLGRLDCSGNYNCITGGLQGMDCFIENPVSLVTQCTPSAPQKCDFHVCTCSSYMTGFSTSAATSLTGSALSTSYATLSTGATTATVGLSTTAVVTTAVAAGTSTSYASVTASTATTLAHALSSSMAVSSAALSSVVSSATASTSLGGGSGTTTTIGNGGNPQRTWEALSARQCCVRIYP